MNAEVAKNYWRVLPDFGWSHILLRIPLAVVFIQQGLSKLPFDPAGGSGFGLGALTWWFVVYGEILAGIGLLAGGVASLYRIRDIPFIAEIGDLLTRFSGIVMCCIATGVIWVVMKPDSLMAVINDSFHLFLWVGGLYFALRGNWAVAASKKQEITHD
jgi:DoxX.